MSAATPAGLSEAGVDEQFRAARSRAEKIEGMMSPFSMAVVDSILSFQCMEGIRGNVTEFGVFHGKSAAILGSRMRPEERLILVDIADKCDRASIPRPLEFYRFKAEQFPWRMGGYTKLRGTVRFAHIDASHRYRATFNEVAVCDELISDDGLIALDDFTNLNYSQILAATFKYLYTTETDLVPAILTAEKAYLCRRSHFPLYAEYALSQIVRDLEVRGFNGCIARTDVDPEYQALHVREKLSGEADDKYGFGIYKSCYDSPARSKGPFIASRRLSSRNVRQSRNWLSRLLYRP